MAFQVLTAEVSHETNTFSIRPTDFAAFAERGFLLGSRAIEERGNSNTDLAGFVDIAKSKGWRLTHAVSASAQPAGMVTRDAFARITQPILDGARRFGDRLDGVLLSLHGAMVTEDAEDGEGALLSLLREIVGPDLPIAITLDPHANVTPQMCALADMIVSYKTYPHVDMRHRARQAGEILHRTMLGEILPRTLRVHRPMLNERNGGRTDAGPMIARLATARALEDDPDVFAVSINAGFASADIAEVGPTVLVTYQGDEAAPLRAAEALADDIWKRRFEVLETFLTVEAAAALAIAHEGGAGPLVIADYADNPGGGAYADSTALLAALLDAGVAEACFGPMVDAAAAQSLSRCSVGDTATLARGAGRSLSMAAGRCMSPACCEG